MPGTENSMRDTKNLELCQKATNGLIFLEHEVNSE